MRKRFALFTFFGAFGRRWLHFHVEPSVIVAVLVGGHRGPVRIVVVGVRRGRGGRGGPALSLQSVDKPKLANVGFMLTI